MDATMQALNNEHQLVSQATVEPKAFADLYDHYFPRIFTYIRYRVDDDATADDLTAYVFERALSQLKRYNPDRAPFAAWLFGIARNAVSNHGRRKRRWQWLSLDSIRDQVSNVLQPEETAVQQETEEQLLYAVSQLNDRERDLVALKFSAGMTNRGIADLTNLSESNVGVIIHRALNKLRATLTQQEHNDEP